MKCSTYILISFENQILIAKFVWIYAPAFLYLKFMSTQTRLPAGYPLFVGWSDRRKAKTERKKAIKNCLQW